MKKLVVILGLVLLAGLTAVPSWAGGGIGVSASTWDTDNADDDTGPGIKVEFDTGDRVDFEVRFSGFDELAQVGNNALFRIEAFPVDVGLAYTFGSGKVEPYIGAGGTYVFLSADFDGGTAPVAGTPEMDEEYGFYAVVGVEAPIGDQWAFYAEALYRSIKGKVESNDFGFTDFTTDLTGGAGTIGLMFRW